jgi:hypothetical protein
MAPLFVRDAMLQGPAEGSDGRVYWASLVFTSNDDGWRATATVREVHEDGSAIVPGFIATRKILDTESFAEEWEDIEADLPDDVTEDELDAHYERHMKDYSLDLFHEALAHVGVLVGDWAKGPRTSGNVRITTREQRSVAEAINEAWPHDGWTGTAAEIHALIGDEYSLDTMKRALQRGPYESSGEPGKPAVWRRVVRARR